MSDCTRCGGSGDMPQFRHVMGGVCFRCWGSGQDPNFDRKAELEAWLDKARVEYRRLAEALRKAPPDQRPPLQKQLRVLTSQGKSVRKRLDQLNGRRPQPTPSTAHQPSE